ncbi:MAG: hypothetical protein ACREQM_11550 [Candidatus Dormibacteraceae bacterium]
MTRAGSAFLGGLAGAGLLVVVLLLGWFLYQRLSGDSLPLLIGIAIVALGAGLYGGWLLGWLVYSALSQSEDDAGGQLP